MNANNVFFPECTQLKLVHPISADWKRNWLHDYATLSNCPTKVSTKIIHYFWCHPSDSYLCSWLIFRLKFSLMPLKNFFKTPSTIWSCRLHKLYHNSCLYFPQPFVYIYTVKIEAGLNKSTLRLFVPFLFRSFIY